MKTDKSTEFKDLAMNVLQNSNKTSMTNTPFSVGSTVFSKRCRLLPLLKKTSFVLTVVLVTL